MHTTQCQPTFGHSARSVLGSSTSGAARLGGAVRRTARPGDGSRRWRMTFSPGPASFIRGRKSASPSGTRGGSRVPEWGPLGSVRGALSNERPYRDVRNSDAKLLPLKVAQISAERAEFWPQKQFAATALCRVPDVCVGGRLIAETVTWQFIRQNRLFDEIVGHCWMFAGMVSRLII